MWSRPLRWAHNSPVQAAALLKPWCLCVLQQLPPFLFVISKRKEWIQIPVSDGVDAVLKCGEHLPWLKCPAYQSRANEWTPGTQKHEAWFFLPQTCFPERQSGVGRRPEAQNAHQKVSIKHRVGGTCLPEPLSLRPLLPCLLPWWWWYWWWLSSSFWLPVALPTKRVVWSLETSGPN